MNRVVVTGMGALSPVGPTAPASFEALLAGRSGVVSWTAEVDERFETRIAAPVLDLDASAVLGKKDARRHARFTQLAAVAAAEAMRDAELKTTPDDAHRTAVILGVGLGGLECLHDAALALRDRGPSRVQPFGLPALIPNMAAGIVATLAGATGPCFSISSACASSAHAIGEATRLIRAGVIDRAITGGCEGCLNSLAIACFARMGALSKRNEDPVAASRPFDRDRDGFVIAEGAGILVLEALDHARARGARIHGEILGYHASADAFHPTAPDPEGVGASQAMRGALADARLDPSQIDYLNAHGTSTVVNDAVESIAIRRTFGSAAERLWVSSTKSMTGHMLGGAGAFESIVALQSLRHGAVPPTINYQTPDPPCDLDYVPNHARERRLRYVMSNSFGFAGQNASLVLGAFIA
jgi:3-oxoacyl-[acyl-carrier-protein] synthase II